ncbi:MAG: ADP-forming succinate--CoA ligase subunit beta [Bifidobacteriaceae bacterium]|nr:ADP-forming succinate--CoA ligase subunit beta [Bifidobacteriaceae bacterium]
MDLYEYQARTLLEQHSIPVPKAIYVQNIDEVEQAVQEIGLPCVLKSQVRTGHRGQLGGIKKVDTLEEALHEAKELFPRIISGHKTNGLLVTEAKNIIHEYYVSISVDRSSHDYVLLATANGGTEVEEIAHQHPENVKKLHISPLDEITTQDALSLAEGIGFFHADVHQAASILLKMWQCFKENDATLVEINPLAKIGDPEVESSKSLCALDAKISLDNAASFRHPEWDNFSNTNSHDPLEVKAREHDLHYVHLTGEVGVIGNGAGLVMSSLDCVAGAGYNVQAANFLDIGGGASAEVMKASLEIILSDPQVSSIFVNIYGGITSCKLVAQGIIEGLAQVSKQCPIVVRFDGNEAREGLQLLQEAKLPHLYVSENMEDAARLAAKFAFEAKGEAAL